MNVCKWKNCNNIVTGRRIYCSKQCSQKSCVDRRRKELKLKAVTMLGGKCSVCNYSKSIRALHFHHIRDKSFGIAANGVTRPWDEVKKELEKCILLCANCHAETHDNEYNVTPIKKADTIIEKNCKSCGKKVRTFDPNREACSQKCRALLRRKTEWPTKEELSNLIDSLPITEIAKIYKVSDKSVHKWCKNYGIEKKGRGYWSKNDL